jgi:hypothetical protein
MDHSAVPETVAYGHDCPLQALQRPMIEVRLVLHRPCNFCGRVCGARGHLDAPASLAFEAMVLMPRRKFHDDGYGLGCRVQNRSGGCWLLGGVVYATIEFHPEHRVIARGRVLYLEHVPEPATRDRSSNDKRARRLGAR